MPEEKVAFPVLGRPLAASGASPSLGEWLEEHWRFDEYTVPPHAYHITIEASRARSRPRIGTALTGHATLAEGELPFERRGTTWSFGDDGCGVDVEPGTQSARIVVRGWGDGAAPRPLALALQVAMTEALRASGLVPLHASVVNGPRGATAFLGVSGTGKSTTLLQAWVHGAQPVAEDLCWLDPASATVFGWDRAVRVWPDTLRRFADVRATGSSADGKLVVPYAALGASGDRTARLRRLVILTRDAARRPGWEAVASHAVVGALWEAMGVPLSEGARRTAERAVADLVRRLELARLVLGEGPPPDLVS